MEITKNELDLIYNLNKQRIVFKDEIGKYHECLHLYLNHKPKKCKYKNTNCIIRNILFDIEVNSKLSDLGYNVYDNTKSLLYLLNKYYDKEINNVDEVNCDNCNYKNYNETISDIENYLIFEFGDNDQYDELKKSIEKEIKKVYKKKYYSNIKDEKYRKSNLYVVKRYDISRTVNIIVDISSSIDREKLITIIEIINNLKDKYKNVKIFSFSDKLYKDIGEVKHITNFKSVVDKFYYSDNIILISDCLFSNEDLSLLKKYKYKVIQV